MMLCDLVMAKGLMTTIYKGLLYNLIINKTAQRYCVTTTYRGLFRVPGKPTTDGFSNNHTRT
ncbi:hypothetical protein HF289_08785 [Acidithiobacillus ferrooxidans]|nr:hypothetical protein [Acidithiobacillus ferrooxidans]MBU2860251.1 hypothetical protein [Acidithiobacillus ferrooxidans]